MRCLRTLWVLLPALGLIAFPGGGSLVFAGQSPSHATHFVSNKGPRLPQNEIGCYVCHADARLQCLEAPLLADGEFVALTDVCDPCHSEGGAFDGVAMAKINWNSGVYEADGKTLKPGKEQWCATCHDQSVSGVLEDGDSSVLEDGELIEDFQGYADSTNLQNKWKKGGDADKPTLEPHYYGNEDAYGNYTFYKDYDDVVHSGRPYTYYNYDVISGQYIRVTLNSDTSTSDSGSVKRDFVPSIDLSGMDSFNFYVKVQDRTKIRYIRVKLRNSTSGDWSICDSPGVNSTNGFMNYVWRLVSLPRRSFDNNTDAHWGSVDRISIVIYDKKTESYTTSVWLDEIGSEFAGPNVVGDNENWGCYKTGHGSCTSCHDPSSDHIDGNRADIFDYIKYEDNPTNFRFYNDKQMGLPFNCDTMNCNYGEKDPYYGYYLLNKNAFALCYSGGCHLESNVMKYAIAEDLYGFTNFTDTDYWFGGSTANANLHVYHMKFSPEPWRMTCVLCHDPHGQSNPAMTRYEMGNLFYFDPNGCEIVLGADSDSDGTDDWHDPDVNKGAAQTTYSSYGHAYYGPICNDFCHLNHTTPNPACPDRSFTGGNDGYYRPYQYIPVGEPGGE